MFILTEKRDSFNCFYMEPLQECDRSNYHNGTDNLNHVNTHTEEDNA